MSADHLNSVRFINHTGGDVQHAKAAWASTSVELTPETEKRIPGLLKYLAEHNHGSPFEHSQLTFLVTSDVTTHYQFLRHRHMSFNTESGRYKELKDDKFLIPAEWPSEWQDKLEDHMLKSYELYHACLASLENDYGFTRARAKESSRLILPLANQINYYVTLNFRAFIHFLGLRNKPEAQKEIREIAEEMLHLVRQIPGNPFEHSLAAFFPQN